MTEAVTRRTRGSAVRPLVWFFHLLHPLLGLWLLVTQPGIDVRWEDHPSHFWLMVSVVVVNVVIAARMGAEASRRSDARLFLVSQAFVVGAGFLGLHALATPEVLLGKNAGFVVATPAGLLLAGILTPRSRSAGRTAPRGWSPPWASPCTATRRSATGARIAGGRPWCSSA